MSNENNPRGAGRKPTIAKDGGRRINVHLDEDTVRIARELGNGNLSLGIREGDENNKFMQHRDTKQKVRRRPSVEHPLTT